MSGRTYDVFKSESTCQWCGWKFEIRMSPFVAAEFRAWADMVRVHKIDCKEAFCSQGRTNMIMALGGHNAAGEHFLGGAA